MLKLGDSDVSKLYLADAEVKKMYLGDRLVFEPGGEPPVPGNNALYPDDTKVLYPDETELLYL